MNIFKLSGRRMTFHPPAVLVFLRHDQRVLRQKQAGYADQRVQIAAAVVAQINDQPLQSLLAHHA